MTSTPSHVLLADVPHQARRLLRVTGDDALRFLQGLLTADVGELTPGTAKPAALLTVKGKIVSELWVLAVSEDEPWLALPAELAESVTKSLDDHIIMDDVELETLDDHACALLWDGEAIPVGDGEGELRSFATTHPIAGQLLVGPAPALRAALEARGSREADAETFTRRRVAEARPAWGHELGPDRFPPEVGFVDAVSYDKGCYLGQEPLSRIHNRGKVNRVMVRVRAPRAPEGDEPVPLWAGEVEVGRWTSWAPAADGQEGVVGLAVIKRSAASTGSKLNTGEIAVEVDSDALGDDPGIGKPKQSGTVSLGGPR